MTQWYKTTTIVKNQITGTCSGFSRKECKAYMFDVLKSFETMKENRKRSDDSEHRLTTTERQVQCLNTTCITSIIANLFYDIISMLKWFRFARPEGFDIIHLLMTKLQTG